MPTVFLPAGIGPAKLVAQLPGQLQTQSKPQIPDRIVFPWDISEVGSWACSFCPSHKKGLGQVLHGQAGSIYAVYDFVFLPGLVSEFIWICVGNSAP